MPLTKAKSQVIDIDTVSDALAQNIGNVGGIIEYIDTAKNEANTFTTNSVNVSQTTLQNQIDTINDLLIDAEINVTNAGKILFKDDNLAGLTNIVTARTNIGIVDASVTQKGLIQIGNYSDISATGSLVKAAASKHVYDAINALAITPLTAQITSLDSSTFKIANKFNEFGVDEAAKNTARFNLGIGNATVATRGLIALAAEADISTYTSADSNNNDAITPALLSIAFNNMIARESSGLTAENGYFEFPNGFTVQWVKAPMSSQTFPMSITLPKPITSLSAILPSYTKDFTNPSSIAPITSHTINKIMSGANIIGFTQSVGFPGAGGTLSFPSSTGTGYGHTWFIIIGKV